MQKMFVKILKQTNLGEYNYLHVQSEKLLLVDVFENFQNICLKIHEPDPARFLTTPCLAWQPNSRKTKVKLDLLTDIDMY